MALVNIKSYYTPIFLFNLTKLLKSIKSPTGWSQCDQASTRCAGTSPTYGGPTSCQENQKGPLLCHSPHGFCAGLLSPASLFPPPVITIHIHHSGSITGQLIISHAPIHLKTEMPSP